MIEYELHFILSASLDCKTVQIFSNIFKYLDMHLNRLNMSHISSWYFITTAAATLFFGNLSLDLDEKALKSQIEQFTGTVQQLVWSAVLCYWCYHSIHLPHEIRPNESDNITLMMISLWPVQQPHSGLWVVTTTLYFQCLVASDLIDGTWSDAHTLPTHLIWKQNPMHIPCISPPWTTQKHTLSLPLCLSHTHTQSLSLPLSHTGAGTVASVRFPTDQGSMARKGYAYVDIHRMADAKRVSQNQNQSSWNQINSIKCTV